MPPVRATNGQQALISLLIIAATVLCYWNTKDCGFVRWDDTGYVTRNPLVIGDGGLKAIWTDVFKEKPVKIYYPLAWTSYWIEYKFFGGNASGYHVVQMALHAMASVAVFLAMVSLGAPLLAAAAAGLLFAVHPVNVASVAWIAERKNTLSAVFFWLSLFAYVWFRRRQGAWRYILAIIAFQLSLFAKTACVVLAPILVVTDRLLDGRWSARSAIRTSPFFVIALIMGLVTAGAEAENRKSGEPLGWLMRPFVAAASLVHYVIKTLVPIELVPVYRRWPESLSEPRYWLSVATVVVAAGIVWRFRKSIAPLAWWSIAVFLIAVALVLGFIQFNFLQFSFVSDHFIYLALPPLLLLVGLALEKIATGPTEKTDTETPPNRGRRSAAWSTLFAAAIALGVLTVRQNRIWKDPESFWTYTLEHNPECDGGAFNLGNHYFERQNYEAAMPRYALAAKLAPQVILYQRACARCAKQLGHAEEALAYYGRAIENHVNKRSRGISDRLEYASYLLSLNRPADAIKQFEKVLEYQPSNASAARGVQRAKSQLNASPF